MPLPHHALRRGHLLDPDAKSHSGVLCMRRGHPHVTVRRKLPFDLHLKPRREFFGIAQCAPHPLGRRLNLDGSINTAQFCGNHYATSKLHDTPIATSYATIWLLILRGPLTAEVAEIFENAENSISANSHLKFALSAVRFFCLRTSGFLGTSNTAGAHSE